MIFTNVMTHGHSVSLSDLQDSGGRFQCALSVCNPLEAIGTCWRWWEGSTKTSIDEAQLGLFLLQAIRSETAWTSQRLAAVRALLKQDPLFEEVEAELAIAERSIVPWGPGLVNVLFVERRSGLGTVLPLRVTLNTWGGGIQIKGGRASNDFQQAFWNGCLAATDLIHQLGSSRSGRLKELQFNGDVPGLRVPVYGESLGLAAAIAVLSRLTAVEVPQNVGLSAQIEAEGRLKPVEFLTNKLAAAEQYGLHEVWVAERQEESADVLRRSGSVRDVAEKLFGDEIAKVARRRFDTTDEGDETEAVRPDLESVVNSGRDVLLISAVGRSDPFGKMRDPQGNPVGADEGPILGAVRALKPSVVCLFYTETTQPGNRFELNAMAVKTAVEAVAPSCRVELLPMLDLSDPSDLHMVLGAFGERLDAIRSLMDERHVVINVSSGTPQMQIAWHLLEERHRFGPRPPMLLQVRETRWIEGSAGGSSRLRIVRM